MPELVKRRPILADRFLATPSKSVGMLYHPKAVEQVRRSLINANRFVLDAAGAQSVAKVVMEVPDLLIREHKFATPPHDVMWLEWPCWYYWERFRQADPERYAAYGASRDSATADETMGFLIDHGRVNVITGGTHNDPDTLPVLTALQYRLHTEWPIGDQLEFGRRIGASRIGIDAFLWGSTWDQLSHDERRLLRNYNIAEFLPLNPTLTSKAKLNADGGMAGVADGAVGELRTLVAILLLLNRPNLTRYEHTIGHARGFIKNKLRSFLSHTTVTLDLDPVPELRKIGTPADAGVPKRRHVRRGHYAHNQEAHDYARIAGCIHEWKAAIPQPGQWRVWDDAPADDCPENGVFNWLCTACGGHRWWVDACEPGDASLGYVEHYQYRVTTKHRPARQPVTS